MSEQVLEILVDFANAVEAAAVNVKHKIAEITGVKGAVTVKEETFDILKFETQKGAKIGPYQVAYKAQNIPDKWNHAYGILRQNNATIANRYRGDGYTHSYWLYGSGKIYRQKLKAPNKSS